MVSDINTHASCVTRVCAVFGWVGVKCEDSVHTWESNSPNPFQPKPLRLSHQRTGCTLKDQHTHALTIDDWKKKHTSQYLRLGFWPLASDIWPCKAFFLFFFFFRGSASSISKSPEKCKEIKLCCKFYHSGKSDIAIANRQVSMEAFQLELWHVSGGKCPEVLDVETVSPRRRPAERWFVDSENRGYGKRVLKGKYLKKNTAAGDVSWSADHFINTESEPELQTHPYTTNIHTIYGKLWYGMGNCDTVPYREIVITYHTGTFW